MKHVVLCAGTLLLAACGSSLSARDGSQQASPTKTIVDSQGIFRPIVENDGTYLVGAEMPIGKYRNHGGARCYWARLRSLDATDVLESKTDSSPQVVQIHPEDIAFLTRGCGIWQMDPSL